MQNIRLVVLWISISFLFLPASAQTIGSKVFFPEQVEKRIEEQ